MEPHPGPIQLTYYPSKIASKWVQSDTFFVRQQLPSDHSCHSDASSITDSEYDKLDVQCSVSGNENTREMKGRRSETNETSIMRGRGDLIIRLCE